MGKLYSMLDDDGTGINSRLSQALNQTDSLKRLFSKVQEYEERLRSCYIDLKDLSSEIGVLVNDVEINPARMDQVNDRLNLIYDLQQKHRVNTLAELISLRNELAGRLANIESSDEALTSLRNELKAAEKTAAEKATILSNARSKARKPLEDKLTNLLKQLGMPKAALKIEQQKKAFETDGADTIRFLFSANTNARLQPIDEIASGGEISRIMLCIKSVIADTSSLSTLVFDEIDTGVSGEIADKMGDIMQDIAESRQVICITHLPQIAAKGKDHFKVIKTDIQGHSQTVVNRLTDKDRLMEIAQMLSGANVTDAAILNARTLLIENTKQ
ncbi:MAG: hypothetical protein Q8914_05725 [Bacteroidota bacterium]|nr:hypothetical protein [Bacteroidota bacterium]